MPVSTLLQSKSLQVTFGLSGLTEKSHMLHFVPSSSKKHPEGVSLSPVYVSP